MQRHGGEVGNRRVPAIDVPDVDDDAAGIVTGVLDQLQPVAQGLDVRPGKELDPEAGPDLVGLARQLGELVCPLLAVPGASSPSGVDLDVPGTQSACGLEHLGPNPVGCRAPRPIVPPVRNVLQLEVGDSVVGQHSSNAAEAVGRHGGWEIGREQAESPVAGRGRGFDPLAQVQRTAKVGPIGCSVTGARPACRQDSPQRSAAVGRSTRRPAAVPASCQSLRRRADGWIGRVSAVRVSVSSARVGTYSWRGRGCRPMAW